MMHQGETLAAREEESALHQPNVQQMIANHEAERARISAALAALELRAEELRARNSSLGLHLQQAISVQHAVRAVIAHHVAQGEENPMLAALDEALALPVDQPPAHDADALQGEVEGEAEAEAPASEGGDDDTLLAAAAQSFRIAITTAMASGRTRPAESGAQEVASGVIIPINSVIALHISSVSGSEGGRTTAHCARRLFTLRACSRTQILRPCAAWSSGSRRRRSGSRHLSLRRRPRSSKRRCRHRRRSPASRLTSRTRRRAQLLASP